MPAEEEIKERTYSAACVDAIVDLIYELNRLDNMITAADVPTVVMYDWQRLYSLRDSVEEHCDIHLPDLTPIKDSADVLATYGPAARDRALMAYRTNYKEFVKVLKSEIRP